MHKHITEVLPHEYQKAITGINQVLKIAWSIIDDKDSVDNKTRLQALALINDCNKYKMDLATGGAICSEALKFVTQKQEQIDTLIKLDERIETIRAEEDTNGVY